MEERKKRRKLVEGTGGILYTSGDGQMEVGGTVEMRRWNAGVGRDRHRATWTGEKRNGREPENARVVVQSRVYGVRVARKDHTVTPRSIESVL